MSVIMPVITVQMVIEENKKANNNIKVRLIEEDSFPQNVNVLWEGMLFDIPEQYRGFEALYTGWLIREKCYYITVWG